MGHLFHIETRVQLKSKVHGDQFPEIAFMLSKIHAWSQYDVIDDFALHGLMMRHFPVMNSVPNSSALPSVTMVVPAGGPLARMASLSAMRATWMRLRV